MILRKLAAMTTISVHVYFCKDCEFEFAVSQHTDHTFVKCPNCGTEDLKEMGSGYVAYEGGK